MDLTVRGSFPGMGKRSDLLQNIQTSNGAQPASYSVGSEGYIPGDKVPGAGHSTQTPKLNPRPAHMEFMVDKVPVGEVSLHVFCFPPPLSFYQRSTLSHLTTAVAVFK